jgi:hypothetical protein
VFRRDCCLAEESKIVDIHCTDGGICGEALVAASRRIQLAVEPFHHAVHTAKSRSDH